MSLSKLTQFELVGSIVSVANKAKTKVITLAYITKDASNIQTNQNSKHIHLPSSGKCV